MMTTIFSGLSTGAVYALVAVLFSIPLLRSGIFNFAQAHYVVLGGYVCSDLLGRAHLNIVLAIGVLAVLGGLLGALQEVLTIRTTKADFHGTLLTVVGVSIVLGGFMIFLWGTDPRSVSFFGGSRVLTIFGGRLDTVDVWLIALAVLAGVGTEVALRATRWGLIGRAVMTDSVGASLRGLNVAQIRTSAFVFAGAASCALAPIVAPKIGVSADTAFHLIIFSFAGAAIGGLGSFIGAMVGGFTIGMVEAFASRYVGVEYVDPIIFVVLIFVLLSRPTGIFGHKILRAV